MTDMKTLGTVASFTIAGAFSVFLATGVAAASENAPPDATVDLLYGPKISFPSTLTVADTAPYTISLTKDGLSIVPPDQVRIRTATFLQSVPFSQKEDYYTSNITVKTPRAVRKLIVQTNAQQCLASNGDIAMPCTAEPAPLEKSPPTPKKLAKVTVGWESLVDGPGSETIAIEIVPHNAGSEKTNTVRATIRLEVRDNAKSRSYITASKTYKTGQSTADGAIDNVERASGEAVNSFSALGRAAGIVDQDTGEFEAQFTSTLKALPGNDDQKLKCKTCSAPQADDAANKAFHLPKPSKVLGTQSLADAGGDFEPFDWTTIKNLDAGAQYINQFGPVRVAAAGVFNSKIGDGIVSLANAWGPGAANQLFITHISANHLDKSGHSTQTGISLTLATPNKIPAEPTEGSYRHTTAKFFGKYIVSNAFAGNDSFAGVRVDQNFMTAQRHAVDSYIVAAYRATGTGYSPVDGGFNELIGVSGPIVETGTSFSANSALHANVGLTLGGYNLSNVHGQQAWLTFAAAKFALSKTFSLEYDASSGQITGGLIKHSVISTTLYPRREADYSVGYDNGTFTHLAAGFKRELTPDCNTMESAGPPVTYSCNARTPRSHLTFEAAGVHNKAFTFGLSYGGVMRKIDNASILQSVQQLLYAGYRFRGCNGLYAALSNANSQDSTPSPGSAVNIFLEHNELPWELPGTFYLGYNNTTATMQPPGTSAIPTGTPTRNRSFYFKLRLGTSQYHNTFCS